MSSARRLSFLLLGGFTLLAAIFNVGYSKPAGKVPKYLRMCKKNDPDIDVCLRNLFESLRPKFSEGIPEIDLPPLDPLFLKEVVVMRGGHGKTKAIGHDVKIYGISTFKLNHIKANVDKLEVEVDVSFPHIQFEGTYDVNAKFVNMPVVGKGPIRGNASDVTGKAQLKGRFVEENKSERYVEFYSAVVDVDVKDYYVRVEHLFPDKQLNEAINVLLNDRKLQSMASAKPIVNKVAATMMLEMLNRITRNLPFDELFA